MTWYDFGKDRESLHYKGEMYKKTVIRYYETQGYSLIASSSIEGGLADIIMEKSGKPDLHIEAKDADVSIFSKGKFKEELLRYFLDWLRRPPNKRFEFSIFCRYMTRREDAKEILGYDANKEKVLEWFKDIEGLELVEKEIEKLGNANDTDIYEFFRNVSVKVAVGYDIDDEIKERLKRLQKNPTSYINKLYNEVKRRKDPLSQKSEVIINFLPIEYPNIFYQINSKYRLTKTIHEKLDEHGITTNHPVFIVPRFESEQPVIRSFDAELDVLSPYTESTLIPRNFVELDEQRQRELLNIHLNHLFYCKGLRRADQVFYFAYDTPVLNNQNAVLPLVINGPKENLKEVSKIRLKNDGTINFVEHHTIQIRLKKLGNRWGLFIQPRFFFTEDGIKPLEGEDINRIERKYRNPQYVRNENTRSDLLFWEFFLVNGDYIRGIERPWFRQFKIHPMQRLQINWESEVPKLSQPSLESFLGDRNASNSHT